MVDVRQLEGGGARVLERRARVQTAAEQQRRHVGQRPGERRADRVAGPGQAVVDVARAQDGLGVEGVVVGRRDRGQRLLGGDRAIGHGRRAREGQRDVGAARGDVEADREVLLARLAALADAPQAHERRAVAPARGADGGGQGRLQERVQIAGDEQEGELVGRGVLRGALASVRVVVVAAQRTAGVDPPHERAHVGHRVLRRVATGAVRALLVEHARQVAVGVEQEGVGAVGADDRVEDQPVDVLGEGARVLQGDVGAVRDPHERDLVRAQRLAQRIDVEHGVGRRVEGALRPDAVGAVGHRLRRVGVQRAQPLQVGTAQDARLAGPALVEHRQAVAPQRRVERDRERRGRRDGRLSRPARQGDEDLLRPLALDGVVQRDGPGRGARAIERHVERGAPELVLAAARRQGRRRRCGCRCEGRERDDEESGERSGAQGPATVHASTEGRSRLWTS